ncbi:MAG: assimilatory sulfite reductase (NADPH) flavoprotein subunit [Xanthomonadaceae bacterium]|nr:assimilatory sulfite reductase (NADPH) flavoprotein subunit [Xanthomonadaceae bacterium]
MLADPSITLPSPLTREQSDLVLRLTQELDNSHLWWLSGYLAGIARRGGAGPIIDAGASAPTADSNQVTVVYGSQTGNARKVAESLFADLRAAGLSARLVRADVYPTRELVQERLLYVVISTQGEGDPPDDAIGLIEYLDGRRAPKLPELKYAVLGLGDSSYADFCGIGRRLDARLAELGAQRLFDAGEADLDIASVAGPWRASALEQAGHHGKTSGPAAETPTPIPPAVSASSTHTPASPFRAEVIANQRISGRDFKGPAYAEYAQPDKHIRHIELALEGSDIRYEPGDALGIVHRNSDALVDATLDSLSLSGDAEVSHEGASRPLREWLAAHRELTRLSRPFLAAHIERGAGDLAQLLEPGRSADLARLFNTHQLIDLLQHWPVDWSADAFVASLRPVTARLYSIASSRKRVGDEAHLTVDILQYEAFGRAHAGAASHYLAQIGEGGEVPVFLHRNERFRVPSDTGRDIIMIGPGTGVAPFRAFVQERAETGASGRNWLCFGAQHFNSDFLYQREWQQALQRGELHRLDLAFSRDQADKIYIQHRLRERGRELFDWLRNGAHLYVCGGIAMSKDVHAALRDIVAEHGALDQEDASAYLTDLQSGGRYSRDVY